MNRIMAAALTATLLAFGATTAMGDQPALPKGYVSAVGSYVWNQKASQYQAGDYAKEQTMEVTRDDPGGIVVTQAVTMADGKKFEWGFKSNYDGTRQPGEWISVAVKRLTPDSFGNDYVMSDGHKGYEVATITPERITIRGAFDDNGKKSPYVEVWDRVKK
jgi:hypothetical protein